MACSKQKRPNVDPLPAVERYDGPSFRVLRHFLAKQVSAPLDVYVLSAEFGLIPNNELIPDYERVMTRSRAQELNPQVCSELASILNNGFYQSFGICLGEVYLQALRGFEGVISSEVQTSIFCGGSGQKLAGLHSWLYGGQSLHTSVREKQRSLLAPRFRGVEVNLTPAEVLVLARQVLKKDALTATAYHSWYVSLDGQRVSPKWLVSHLTNLPVRSFHTDEARRLLEQLGIPVYLDQRTRYLKRGDI